MAAPTFVAAGTGLAVSSGSGNATLSGIQVGDLVILHVLADGGDTSFITVNSGLESLAGVSGFMDELGSGFNIGTGAGVHRVYLARATLTSVSVNVNLGGGADCFARLYAFRGVAAGTTMADVVENIGGSFPDFADEKSGLSTAIAAPDMVTDGADRLCLCFVGVNDDNAVGNFTGEAGIPAGGDWTEAVAEFASATGTDACIQLQTTVVNGASTLSGGTYTMAASDSWGTVAFALKPFITPDVRLTHFRFRNDDGNETGATWKAAVDTVPSAQALDETFRLRIGFGEVNGGDPPNDAYAVQFRVNAGAWTSLSDVTAVKLVPSPNFADLDATTQQITSGSFLAGFMFEGAAASAIRNLTAIQSTEYEMALQLDSASIADGDVIEFRVLDNSTSVALTSNVTPSVTAASGALSLDAGKVASGAAVHGANLVADTATLSAGKVASGADIRGADIAPSGSATIAAGKIASAAIVRGADVVTPQLLEAGKVASGADVRGADVAASGSATLDAGAIASAVDVRGADVAASGAATLEAGHVPSAAAVAGADLVAQTATLDAGRVPSAAAVRGVTLDAPGVLEAGKVASSAAVRGANLAGETASLAAGKVASGELVRGADVQAGASHLLAGKIGTAVDVRGADLAASGAATIDAAHVPSTETVHGADLAGSGTATLQAGHVASDELVRGADLSSTPKLHPGKITTAEAVRGADLAGVTASIDAGHVPSTADTRGADLVPDTATIAAGKITSGASVRGADLGVGEGSIQAGKVASTSTVRGASISGSGTATLAAGRITSTQNVRGADVDPQPVTLAVSKIGSSTAVRGADAVPATATLGAGKIGSAQLVHGADVTPAGSSRLDAGKVTSTARVRGVTFDLVLPFGSCAIAVRPIATVELATAARQPFDVTVDAPTVDVVVRAHGSVGLSARVP